MDFYDGTMAKQYARNKTRIIKEINDIEENVAQAVDNNEFSCDVYNTVMTDSREFAEPTKDAKAHCVMELDTIQVINENNATSGSTSFIDSIDGDYAIQEEPVDDVMCGFAPDFVPDSYANGGNADNSQPTNYFRVGETLVIQGRNDIKPLEFKVKEVNKNGEIIDLDIVSRGEMSSEIFGNAHLIYKDMDNWLNVDSDYGNYSDLRIDREGKVSVKAFNGVMCDNTPVATWTSIGKTYRLGDLPPSYFAKIGDIFIISGDDIYIKGFDEWKPRKHIYNYQSFKLPINYGIEGMVCYNVFGRSYVKTKCGWEMINHIYRLGESYRPCVFDYQEGDIVIYTQVIRDENNEIVSQKQHTIYKCCSNCWKEIVSETDWHNVPADDFGEDDDLFIYGNTDYRVKIDNQWLVVKDIHRFDMLYYDNTFGEPFDVISYDGNYEPNSTYVKMEANDQYPYGFWVKVEKLWDLNQYLLGRLPVKVKLTWTVKNIILDEKGDGYIYQPSVVFSNGNATAYCKVVNDKVVDVQLLNGGNDYTNDIPEIIFVMIIPTLSKKYYQVWKKTLENQVLQDDMNQVIEYFENTKKYTISRVSDNGSFHWHLSWN